MKLKLAKSEHTEPKRCLKCGEINDAATGIVNKHARNTLKPKPGDIMIYAEDKDGVQQATRDIIRPAKGKARLGPLTFADYTGFEGRWTGLLAHLNTQRKLH